MRVLSIGFMYPPHDLGGGYEVTWRSSVGLMRSRGHTVRVLASDFRAPAPEAGGDPELDVHRELKTYWRDHAFPRMRLRERLELERRNTAILERHLDELQPEVVNWWAMGGMSLSLIETVRRRGVPAVGIVGDEWMHWGPRADAWMRTFRRFPPARIAGGLLGLPTRVNLGSAAIWLFNSETVRRKALEAQPGLNDARVAHPGIDEVLFRPAERSPWAWKLLYLGRMDRRKGVHLAIEALATLPCEATLTLQGSGDDAYAQELRELAAKIGVADRVRYSACPRERLPDVYAAADAVLFPVQWDEPWGLVPLEAMAVGRPVIASGTGGSAEYLRHEENCLVYQPRGSADALAAQVRRLAEDEELRETIVTHGFTTATRFTEGLYNEAILSATEEAATGARVAA